MDRPAGARRRLASVIALVSCLASGIFVPVHAENAPPIVPPPAVNVPRPPQPAADLPRPPQPAANQPKPPEPAPTSETPATDKGPLNAADLCDPCPAKQDHGPRFMFYGEIMYLTARGVDVPFAQPFDGVNPLSVPRGAVGVADTDYTAAYRVGAGVAVGDDGMVSAAYTRFESNTRAAIDVPTGLVLRSLLTFPTTLNAAADSLHATARYDIDFTLIDADYRKLFCCTPESSAYWLAGARYAHLDQDLLGTFSILGTTTVASQINFDGAGPRLGLGGQHRFGRGFYGYGEGVVNLLMGHFGATYVQRNVFAGTQANTAVGEDRVVPILDLELGVGWTSPGGAVSVRVGYVVSSWFNTLTTTALVDGVRAGNYTTTGDNFRDTLTFDGVVGRIEFRY